MSTAPNKPLPQKVPLGVKLKGAAKTHRIPVTTLATAEVLRKPDWIRVRIPTSPTIQQIKTILRENNLHTVCEEASCPNLPECFGNGTATFMIMGDICTRRCPFCDVGYGRPKPLDAEEPQHLAQAIAKMRLRYVVITSVDRDDLADGGASHFTACIKAIREQNPQIQIEILVPDFRNCIPQALEQLAQATPNVFNHNLETVPRLYKSVRPGARYLNSLQLLQQFKQLFPAIPTKSGLMLGLGEDIQEVEQVMRDMRAHQIDMLTLGQYLQPSKHHLPVQRFVHPNEFNYLHDLGMNLGFSQVASAPLVRSSYHADLQFQQKS